MSTITTHAGSCQSAAFSIRLTVMTVKKIFVSGKVQGVGYRKSCFHAAIRLKLRGWVRNLPDGRVEILVSGPDSDVGSLVAWAKQGPMFAKVKDVSVIDFSIAASEPLEKQMSEKFEIRRDEIE